MPNDSMDKNEELTFWVIVLLVMAPVAALVFTYLRNRNRQPSRWSTAPGFEFPLEEFPHPEDISWHTRVGEEIVERTAEAEAQDISMAEVEAQAAEATAGEAQTFEAPEAQAEAEEVEAPSEGGSDALDDLTKIEGIGPKTQQVFYGSGIKKFNDLANASQERLHQVLDAADLRGNPDTWPEQAALAAEGKWDELASLQTKLQYGRRSE